MTKTLNGVSVGRGNAISVRQICFILIAYNAATKLQLYPSASAAAVGNALLFNALFNLAVQTVIIWSVAYLSSRTDKTFFALLENTFGSIAAKVVYAFFALYFLAAAVVPIAEQQMLVRDAFYDTMPTLYIFLPFFVFSVYAGVKGMTNIGRCADLCLPVFLVTVISFLIMTLGQTDLTNFLPILKQPAGRVAQYSLSSAFRYSESAFLLMFMGHYKYAKGDAAKLTLSYVLGGIFVIAMMAAFFGVYGVLSPTRAYAISNMSVFFPVIGFVGRLDLYLVYAFDIVVLFAIVLNIQLSVHCISRIFDHRLRPVYSLLVNAVLIVVVFLFNNKTAVLQQFAGNWMWIPALLFAYLVPLLCWTLKRRER